MNKALLAIVSGGLSLGALGAAPSPAKADFSIDIEIGNRRPAPVGGRVWVPPVYRDVCERVWVEPIYKSVEEQVWVSDRYEEQTIRHGSGPWSWTEKRTVLVEPAHYETQCRQVEIAPGHWEEVTRKVLVSDGHWETRVYVAPFPAPAPPPFAWRDRDGRPDWRDNDRDWRDNDRRDNNRWDNDRRGDDRKGNDRDDRGRPGRR